MLNQLIKYTIYGFTLLFPLFFLPITPESYEVNKMMLLFVTTLFLLLLLTLKVVKERKFIFIYSSFTLPLFFLALLTLISTLFQSSNPILALTTPLSASTIIAGFVFYLLLTNTRQDPLTKIVIIPAVIISLYVLAMYLTLIPASRFTPAGSLLATAMFLAVVAVYLFFKRPITAIIGVTFITIITVIIVITFHLFTDQKPVILPFQYGWQVFVEILRNFRSLLLGVGPTSFVSLFTLARPAELNMTPYWSVIFTSSSSFFLTLATEAGVLAGGIYLWILIQVIRKARERQDPLIIIVPLLTSLILQLLLPGNMTIFILTLLLLALSSEKKEILHLRLSRFKILNYLLLLPVAAIIAAAGYFAGRAYLAEVLFKSSLDAIVNKSGTEAYNNQRDAIAFNPYLDRYHLAFSQTSMALANAIAGKENLTDEDKQNIPRLIQQSTDFARSATTLNRTNAVNWENLGGVYESIINFAEGADSWAIDSYRQKIILDPLNPQSHFKMGKLLYTLKRMDDAQIYLRQAIGLKKDYAAAHYLLGIIFSADKKYEDAYRELQTSMAYLIPGSDDAKRVEKELADLAKLLPEQSTSSSQIKPLTPSETQTLEEIEATTSIRRLPESSDIKQSL